MPVLKHEYKTGPFGDEKNGKNPAQADNVDGETRLSAHEKLLAVESATGNVALSAFRVVALATVGMYEVA
jgi:hypothetical protein